MTVRELLSRVDSEELSEWQALTTLEPIGDARADVRAALVAQTMWNRLRGREEKPRPLDDFILEFDPPVKKSDEEIGMILENWFLQQDANRKAKRR